METFKLHVFPTDDCDNNYSFFGSGSLGGGECIVWADTKISVASVGSSLFVNDRHYQIPNGSKLVWILNDEVFLPKIGIIQESPVPKMIEEWIDESKKDVIGTGGGVTFKVEMSMMSGCTSNYRIENNNRRDFSISLGGYVFTLKKGRLIYRNKDYGPISEGDLVILDKKRSISIERSVPKAVPEDVHGDEPSRGRPPN